VWLFYLKKGFLENLPSVEVLIGRSRPELHLSPLTRRGEIFPRRPATTPGPRNQKNYPPLGFSIPPHFFSGARLCVWRAVDGISPETLLPRVAGSVQRPHNATRQPL